MNQSNETKLYLVDTLNLVFRTILTKGPELKSPSGVNTKGAYFFTQAILNIVSRPNLKYLAVALDSPRSSLERKKLFPEYKANRKPHNYFVEDMDEQIKLCMRILEALDLPLYKVPGQEADDIIGSIAQLATKEVPAVIVSSDKDLHQLVTPVVTVYNPIDDVWYDEAAVIAKWGVRYPWQVADFKMLAGDTGDNYKGVEQVGKALATKVLQEVDKAEDITVYSGKISERAKAGIAKADFQVLRSLAEIRKDLKIVNSLDNLRFENWKVPEKAKEIFNELGFKRIAR